MARIRKTGKAGGVVLDGTTVPITSWTVTINANTHQNTDTGDYDAGSGQTWESSVYGFRSAEVTFEGNFDLNATSTDVVAKMLADNPLTTVFKFDPSTTFGHGDVILESLDVTSPVDDNIKFTAKGRTAGVFTLGS